MTEEEIDALRYALKEIDLGLRTQKQTERISTFYRKRETQGLLEMVRVEGVRDALIGECRVTDKEISKLKTRLKNNNKHLQEFIISHSDRFLLVSEGYLIPTVPARLRKFEALLVKGVDEKGRVSYTAKNEQAVIKAMETLPKTEIYKLGVGGSKEEETFYKPLIEDCKIKISSDGREYKIITQLLSALLALMKNSAPKGRKVPNLINSDEHQYIVKPSLMGLLDIVAGVYQGRDVRNLSVHSVKDGEHGDEDIIAEGGYLATIKEADPLEIENSKEQNEAIEKYNAALNKAILDKGSKAAAKWLASESLVWIVESVILLQRYSRDHPEMLDPNYDGFIRLSDLAKYVPKYERELSSGHYEINNRLYRGLMLASLISTDYKAKETDSDKIYKKIYIIDRISEYSVSKKAKATDYDGNKVPRVKAVKVKFTREYLKEAQANRVVLLDGVTEMSSAVRKMAAIYLMSRATSDNNPYAKSIPDYIEVSVEDIIQNTPVVSTNSTRLKDEVAGLLNEIVRRKLFVKWANEDGKKVISSYGGNYKRIRLYLTDEMKETYMNKPMNDATKNVNKHTQENRLKNMKKLFSITDGGIRRYTDFQKFLEDLNEEAESMGLFNRISYEDLVLMHGGKNDIDDATDTVVRSLLEQNT